ncbi:MAG: RdgB/HAM1 family non-canonical purine NTP pyrophosphatase [Acutalibacteraceae bacterium]
MNTYVIATHNAKKLAELSRILEPLGIEAVTRELSEAEEIGDTFAANAFIKAESACRETGMPAIADDSGLMVDALGGRPGIYSARYAGENATDTDRNVKLLEELKDVPEEQRTAKFVSAICCVFPNGEQVTAVGECPGRIGFAPKGENGFGYDPLFVVEGGRSYAELSAAEKDAVSHRGRAMRLFAARLREYLGIAGQD